MKFGKKFGAQMVPEWKHAYMDYGYLKTLLEEIKIVKRRNRKSEKLERALTLYRAFSGLIQRQNHYNHSLSLNTTDIENQAILVNSVNQNGSERYETMFLMAAENGGECEVVYFKRLADEFNKVERFYRSKVMEMIDEAQVLSKQMDALIAFRIKVENLEGLFNRSDDEFNNFRSDFAVPISTSQSVAEESRTIHMDDVVVGPSNYRQLDDSNGDKDDHPTNMIDHTDIYVKKLKNINCPRSPLEILDHVKLNKILETPRSTIKGILDNAGQKEPSFNRTNLKRIEKQLKQAFIEFYNKLLLLKNYSHMNTLAFSKIMKKYDKITLRSTSHTFINMVHNSYLGSSDELFKLMERVEATFIKHFANSNRSEAMNTLRPKTKKERHRVSFFMGLFVGCTFALILALILIIHARNLLDQRGKTQYMETMFPLYSLFIFIVLHMLMYAANLYFWRRYRINYSFIFGFKQGTELGYREVFLLSFALAVLALASVLANLDMEMDPKTNDYKALTELVPLSLVLFVIAILLFPFNIMYRSSRFFFVTCLFHCICAPFYKVSLQDFFLADQFTSQVQAIRSFEFYLCYYGWGDYKRRQNTCRTSNIYNTFYFIVAVVPYWSRLLQCLRRLLEEKDKTQMYNGLKYFFTIVAVCTRTAYSRNNGIGWEMTAWSFSVVAAVFGTYWDLVVDWGLLQWQSRNHLLRDKLVLPNKSVYYGAMVLNVLLRFAWLQTVLNFQVSFLHRESLITIVASLEIIRRGIWNFFRLENEHLNNVGKYRAFKSAPLPFDYGD